jgi:hypothetical protein
MGARYTKYSQLSGLLVPDERVTFANLDSSLSSYTEGSPIVGQPVPSGATDLSLRSTGTNSDQHKIDVQTQTSGIPVRNGAGYVWRDSGSSSWYGADHLGLVTGHEVLSATYIPRGGIAVERLEGGRVVAISRPKTLSNGLHRMIFDASADSWTQTTVVSVAGYTFGVGSSPGLCVAPDGKLYLFLQSDRAVNSYRNVDILVSDDKGDSWSVYAQRVVDDNIISTNDLRIRAAVTDAGVFLALGTTESSAQNVRTYAATTPAGPYGLVTSDTGAQLSINAGNGDTDTHDCVALPDGSVLFVTRHTDSANVDAWVSVALPTVSTPIANGLQRQIQSTDLTPDVPEYAHDPAASVWLGEDGDIYGLISSSSGVGDHTSELLRRSSDGGRSWVLWHGNNISLRESSTDYLMKYGAVDMGGRLFVITTDEDEGATRAVYMGGHSTQTFPRGYHILGASYFSADSYVTYAKVTDISPTQLQGALYLPTAIPTDVGWSKSGAASEAITNGLFELSGTGLLIYSQTDTNSAYQGIVAEISLKVTTLTDEDTGITLQLSNNSGANDATYVYAATIKAGTGSFTLTDAISGSPVSGSATVTHDMTNETLIRIAMDKAGNVKTWYGSQSQRRQWSEGPAGTLTDDSGTTPGADTLAKWGKLDSSSQESTWSHVGWCGWPDVCTRLSSDTPAAGYANPEDVRPLDFSPLSQYVRKGIELTAMDGPTLQGEQWTVTADHLYPAESALPEVSPAPSNTYRSDSDSDDQDLVWTLSTQKARLRNSTIGLCLLRCNFKTAKLQYSDNSGGSWNTAATLDLASGLDSLTFTRQGTALLVDTGTAQAAGRYIWPDEFRGSTVKLIGGSTSVRKIKGNSGGSWTDAISRRPVFILEGVDGTEPTSGTCEIWARSGVVIAHEFTSEATHLRLRIDSGTTADGYQEVGQILIGDVFVFGNSPSFGREITTQQRAEISEDSSGATYARRSGLPSRQVSFSWDEGMETRRLYQYNIKPDYVTGTDAGKAVANRGEAVMALESLVSQRLGGAASPVVYLGKVERGSGDHVITDRQLIIYGRVTSNPGVEPFQGYEGKDEVQRSSRVVVSEIPGGWEAP